MNSARVPLLLVGAVMLIGAAIEKDAYGLVAVGIYILGLYTGLEVMRFADQRQHEREQRYRADMEKSSDGTA